MGVSGSSNADYGILDGLFPYSGLAFYIAQSLAKPLSLKEKSSSRGPELGLLLVPERPGWSMQLIGLRGKRPSGNLP